MSHRKTLSRLTIASLACAGLAAPAAVAQPIMDMHASTVHKPAPAQVDLRGEATVDVVKAGSPKVDLRGEAAVETPRTAGPRTLPAYPTPAADTTRRPLPGPPTWPMHPTPLPPRAAPVVADGGDGIDFPESVLIIAGTLALGAGMTVVALRTRPRTGIAQ